MQTAQDFSGDEFKFVETEPTLSSEQNIHENTEEIENYVPEEEQVPEIEEEQQAIEYVAEEPDKEEPVQEKPKVRHRVPAKTRINQIQREKYQALDEAHRLREETQRLAEENERLRQLAEYSTDAAEKHYEDGIKLRLKEAKQQKVQAIESGDIQAQVDADERMASATSELHAHNSWKATQTVKKEQQKRAMEYAPQQPQGPSPYAQRWVEDNANWFHPDSENYHPELAAEAESFADRLDAHLYRTGQQHLIQNSPEYFNEINTHMRNVYKQRYMQSEQRGLNMKQSRNVVGTVRGGMGNSGAMQRQTQKVSLTADEKDIAKKMDVTEQAYLQAKINDMRMNPGKRRGY